MICGDFKDLTRRALSYKILCNKAFNSVEFPKNEDIKELLLEWFRNTLIKCLLLLLVCAIRNENMSNQQIAEELHKSIIRKIEKRNVYPSFKDNIWVLI